MPNPKITTAPSDAIAVRDIPVLALRATVAPGTVDEEARTVDVVWSTGARVLRGFFDKFFEELSLDPKHVRMERINNGAPFLKSHRGFDLDAVIGVVESGSAKVDGKQGTATIRFSKRDDDEDADRVFRKIRDGIIQNVSVGYNVHRFEQVEGGDEEIPVYRAVDWEPFEISAVAMGRGRRGRFPKRPPAWTIATNQTPVNSSEAPQPPRRQRPP